MSIPSPRLLFSNPCALPMLSCQELIPEFHPDDRACSSAGCGRGGGIDGLTCTSDAECTSPTFVCDTMRSMYIQRAADEPGARGGMTPTYGLADTWRSSAIGSECEPMACLQVSDDHRGWVYVDMYLLPLVSPGNNIFVDPELVDTKHSAADVRFKDMSPVWNAADPTAAMVVALGGEARPRGPGREMGADEIR